MHSPPAAKSLTPPNAAVFYPRGASPHPCRSPDSFACLRLACVTLKELTVVSRDKPERVLSARRAQEAPRNRARPRSRARRAALAHGRSDTYLRGALRG